MRPAFLFVPELPQLKARRDEELDSLASLRLQQDLVEAQIELYTQTTRDLVEAQTKLDAQTKRDLVEAQTKLDAQTERDPAEANILESTLYRVFLLQTYCTLYSALL
jgi:hypothetical protein